MCDTGGIHVIHMPQTTLSHAPLSTHMRTVQNFFGRGCEDHGELIKTLIVDSGDRREGMRDNRASQECAIAEKANGLPMFMLSIPQCRTVTGKKLSTHELYFCGLRTSSYHQNLSGNYICRS